MTMNKPSSLLPVRKKHADTRWTWHRAKAHISTKRWHSKKVVGEPQLQLRNATNVGNHCQELSITFGSLRRGTDILIVSGRLGRANPAHVGTPERGLCNTTLLL